MQRPGKIFSDRTSWGADACFSYDMVDYCTHFERNPETGGRRCKVGGTVNQPNHPTALSTFDALPLCDAGVPGCSTDKYVCDGTTASCDQFGEDYWEECGCTPQVGYVHCDEAIRDRRSIRGAAKDSQALRRMFSEPGDQPSVQHALFP